MRKQKGMEVGIGFIITIIIAVMALVLAIQFLQPMFQDITALGKDAIKAGRDTLLKSIDTDSFNTVCSVVAPITHKESGRSLFKISKKAVKEGAFKEKEATPLIGLKNPTTDTKCYRVEVKLDSIGTDASRAYFNKENCFDESCDDFLRLREQAKETGWLKLSKASGTPIPAKQYRTEIELSFNLDDMEEGEHTFAFDVVEADLDPATGDCPLITEKQKWIDRQSCDPPSRTLYVIQ